MILSFSIKNFRSIKEEQVFNLLAESTSELHKENVAFPDKKTGVLKTACIYGANASGKSNLLLALHNLIFLVSGSDSWKLDQPISCYDPFVLDDTSEVLPTRFEIEFFDSENQLYQYIVEYDKTEIHYEELKFYPSAKSAVLFRREKGDTSSNFYIGNYLKGQNKRIPFKKNNLYLSVAANVENSPEVIKSVYRAFANIMVNTRIISHLFFTSIVNGMMKNDKGLKNLAEIFLHASDTGIQAIEIKDDPTAQPIINLDYMKEYDERLKSLYIESAKLKPVFKHNIYDSNKNITSTCYLELNQLSEGSQNLYSFAGNIILALETGNVLVVDEIESSIHPHLIECIIKLFNDPEINKKNAQLIFSTHNSSFMNPEYMRRDQVWFTEKNKYGETSLYSLDEFDKKEVRKNSPFEKYYNEGRFGAIPAIDYNIFKKALVELLHYA